MKSNNGATNVPVNASRALGRIILHRSCNSRTLLMHTSPHCLLSVILCVCFIGKLYALSLHRFLYMLRIVDGLSFTLELEKCWFPMLEKGQIEFSSRCLLKRALRTTLSGIFMKLELPPFSAFTHRSFSSSLFLLECIQFS